MMRRRVIALLGFVLLCAIVVALAMPSSTDHTIYTIAQVSRLVAQSPRTWIGRTVLVRGRITQETYFGTSPWPGQPLRVHWMGFSVSTTCYQSGFSCPSPLRVRLPPGTVVHLVFASENYGTPDPNSPTLWVRSEPDSDLVHALRRLPLLARILPPAQQIAWGPYQVYRLRIMRNPQARCAAPICDDAVLVNGAP